MQPFKKSSSEISAQAKELRLGHAPKGFLGYITNICVKDMSEFSDKELESRLLEFGFIEGAKVQILHEGGLRKDPIAVRVNNNTIALRRNIAMAILVN